MRERSDRQIAYHILYNCEGDNCPCCDWAEEDRAKLEGTTYEEAQALVDNVSSEEDFDRVMDNWQDDSRTTFDMSDDADALASAGMGTDEDYGYYGED